MPELPEVETIVRGLDKEIVGHQILGVETDTPNLFKGPNLEIFEDKIKGETIVKVSRRAKNILISLSGGKTLLIHLKMTGHILVTSDDIQVKNGKWLVDPKSPLADPQNQFIHVVWHLSGNKKMALSDLRKFANVLLKSEDELTDCLGDYGPEPLGLDFTFEKFYENIAKKKQPIKKVLLDQTVVSGVGNIYADEILYEARVNPTRLVSTLSKKEIEAIYENIKSVLKKAVDLRGTSVSDYRDIRGEKGGYGPVRKVYRRTGEPCPSECGGKVERITLGGRGTHFCPNCQK
ncbi:TPA: hypothetical protein DDW69_04805 [candidate division CPR2 bacterium]|uniref:Formamidopyrimidine-DNA glycosylase n=1 Tax=candidate division CPR2 bacterium GW2011_GWC1_41_48 TaxID=1618344 RepID=A0A0G0YIJ3_UNCC2|nr:MAG: Formamidopyrimidine-DNA glycosylase [candidate division CPR2 bacterium GW2011_GWC2_39_35]KKR28299.1 MAG: Formamidopyrimidine-DNA glycosylase [candidate division CPR2 bacterium GW2011_GWD2_39_7]KKR28955.1 MAG: Formamidopyrimidine-DNA glycosylase [candidate division CPR2 bacterium GW2011_GWD1_39_7]KKS09366.1 MAG: Formamidopyrimidine-DNA glycosylase [candidate division CPR2 bacterium GW2011_GWC1_41_48]OGB61785.1 MAG: DNA-formamidopyrimidine glycosylase [candidate division CPR2 bacterium GW